MARTGLLDRSSISPRLPTGTAARTWVCSPRAYGGASKTLTRSAVVHAS